MLVIGDLNSNNLSYDSYAVRHKEYICEDDSEITSCIQRFNLTDDHFIVSNNLSFTYKKKDIFYSFYDASNHIVLKSIHRLSGGNKFKPKYASLPVEWAICKARIKFIHNDVEEWCNRLETYIHLTSEMNKNDHRTKRMIESYANSLSSWVINTYGISKNIYRSRPFDYYKKIDLYETVSLSAESKYMSLMLNKNNFDGPECISDHVFTTRLTEKEKLDAVMEKIYVETINQYIIPELERTGNLPDDLFSCFLKSYMNICSLYTSYRFVSYAMTSYYDIINKYDDRILDIVFYSVHANKLIDKIKQ